MLAASTGLTASVNGNAEDVASPSVFLAMPRRSARIAADNSLSALSNGEGAARDCHATFRTPFYGLSSCDTKNANASIAAVLVTAMPEPVFKPTYRFDS